MPTNSLTWLEISRGALTHNLQSFRAQLRPGVQLCAVIKANAYGHGLTVVTPVLRAAGADCLAVATLAEAEQLRAAGDTGRIYILGYIALADLPRAVAADAEILVYNPETVAALGQMQLPKQVRLHLKVETGAHRQGLLPEAALALAAQIRATPGVLLAGVTAHFANADETTDYSYARAQLAAFERICALLAAAGHTNFVRHTANSAATLLLPTAQFEMVRVGIGTYGLWPSRETLISLVATQTTPITLQPVLTWKTKIAQIRWIPAGAAVGYGCTWTAARPTRLGILPMGYADGFARALSGRAYVLVGGQRVPVVGRVCMNVVMVDITDLAAEPELEAEVVLLGRQGSQIITAEDHAAWSGTINYEVTTRLPAHLPRVLVV